MGGMQVGVTLLVLQLQAQLQAAPLIPQPQFQPQMQMQAQPQPCDDSRMVLKKALAGAVAGLLQGSHEGPPPVNQVRPSTGLL